MGAGGDASGGYVGGGRGGAATGAGFVPVGATAQAADVSQPQQRQQQQKQALPQQLLGTNWGLFVGALFPQAYDPGYHTTLYEFLFDLWPELNKVSSWEGRKSVSVCAWKRRVLKHWSHALYVGM